MNEFAYFSALLQSILAMMTTFAPAFQRMSQAIFLALATIMMIWEGYDTMFSAQPFSERLWTLREVPDLRRVRLHDRHVLRGPDPVIGYSFTNIVTDQTAWLANVLDAAAVKNVHNHLDAMLNRVVPPSAWDVLSVMLYIFVLVLIVLSKAGTIVLVGFSLIASAVCALVGACFVPFLMVPKLEWLFWGWFKAFLQWSFLQVTTTAYLFIFERWLYLGLTTLLPKNHPGPLPPVRDAGRRHGAGVLRRLVLHSRVERVDLLRPHRGDQRARPLDAARDGGPEGGRVMAARGQNLVVHLVVFTLKAACVLACLISLGVTAAAFVPLFLERWK